MCDDLALMPHAGLRSLPLALVVILALAEQGCSNGGGLPACTINGTTSCHADCSTSIEAYCAGQPGGCDLTWNAVLADPGLCTVATLTSGWSYSVSDCGNYHVLAGGGESGGATDYYDRATGMLVAELFVGHSTDVTCLGGPSGGFTPPDCSGSTAVPPPICATDGGADGASSSGP